MEINTEIKARVRDILFSTHLSPELFPLTAEAIEKELQLERNRFNRSERLLKAVCEKASANLDGEAVLITEIRRLREAIVTAESFIKDNELFTEYSARLSALSDDGEVK